MPAAGDLGAGGTSESSDSGTGEAGRGTGHAEGVFAAAHQTSTRRSRQLQISFQYGCSSGVGGYGLTDIMNPISISFTMHERTPGGPTVQLLGIRRRVRRACGTLRETSGW